MNSHKLTRILTILTASYSSEPFDITTEHDEMWFHINPEMVHPNDIIALAEIGCTVDEENDNFKAFT